MRTADRLSWPGNVRELANIVERLAILHASGVVTAAEVRAVLPLEPATELRRSGSGQVSPHQPTAAQPRRGRRPRPACRRLRLRSHTRAAGVPLADALDGYERTLIANALAAADGNITEAARRLQTDRPNLYRRMRRLGISIAVVLSCALSLAALTGSRALAQGAAGAAPAPPAAVDSPPRRCTPRFDASGALGPVDTVPANRTDTTNASSDAWWRTWLVRSQAPNYTQLSVASLHTYNRVEGLPVSIGPRGRRTFDWGGVSAMAPPSST